MNSTKNTLRITFTGLFLAIAIVAQLLGTYLGGAGNIGQIITGSIINMCLILSGCIVGIYSGLSIAVLSPMLAFLFGLMKLPFAIPVVMIGNIVYVIISVLIFKMIQKKDMNLLSSNLILFFVFAFSACIKALIMWSSAKYVLVMFTKVPPMLIASFSFPQIITGTIGGVLALFLIPVLKKSRAYSL